MIKEDIKQINNVKELQRLFIELNEETEILEKRIDKAIEYIEDKNIVVGTDIEGNLYSSKDILIGILKGE